MSCCHCCCGGRNAANIQDEHVIASFRAAVTKQNETNGTSLEFVRVISATQQVVAGFIFDGVIELNENGAPAHYQVKIWCKPGGQEIEVQNFLKA